MRQQEDQLACIPDALIETFSPKLKGLIGFKTYSGLGMVEGNSVEPGKTKVIVGELSMSQPADFEQDFDLRHSEFAKSASTQPGAQIVYRPHQS